MIEAQLSPEGEPVLGLYLHVAYHRVMASFGRRVGHGQVTPAIIGVVAMLAECPGISQATLARRIGLERATIGTTVARALAAGLIVRHDAHGDACDALLTRVLRFDLSPLKTAYANAYNTTTGIVRLNIAGSSTSPTYAW